MAFKVRKEPRCALAYIGDGGTSEGAFYEALNLAGAARAARGLRHRQQWLGDLRAGCGADRGANPGAKSRGRRHSRECRSTATMYSRCATSVAEALETARRGGGPTLIEALTYRLSDHTTADDASRYRGAEEVKEAWALEPLIRLRRFLVKAGVWDAAQGAGSAGKNAPAQVDAAVTRILGDARNRRPTPCSSICSPALPAHLHEQRATARKYGARNPAVIELAKITMVEAIAMAHGWEMQHDDDVVVIGQDVGANGGVFRATAGLQERFGKDRVQDTPLAEATIAGMSVGMATHGLEAGRGNSVHGIHVSGAGSDRESHVAHAQSHARPAYLPGGHSHAARRRHSRARTPLGKHRNHAVPHSGNPRRVPVLAGARLRPAARGDPRSRSGHVPGAGAPVSRHAPGSERRRPGAAARSRASSCARGAT